MKESRPDRLARAFRLFLLGARRLDRGIARQVTSDFGFKNSLHHEQIAIVCLLGDGPLRQVELARLMDVAPCSVRASLLRLKKVGLVNLEIEKGRKMVAELSSVGKKVAERARVDAGVALHNALAYGGTGVRFLDDMERLAKTLHRGDVTGLPAGVMERLAAAGK